MSFPKMESLPDSRLNSVGIARRKKLMDLNINIYNYFLKNSLIHPISLSPTVLGEVIFNVKSFKIIRRR